MNNRIYDSSEVKIHIFIEVRDNESLLYVYGNLNFHMYGMEQSQKNWSEFELPKTHVYEVKLSQIQVSEFELSHIYMYLNLNFHKYSVTCLIRHLSIPKSFNHYIFVVPKYAFLCRKKPEYSDTLLKQTFLLVTKYVRLDKLNCTCFWIWTFTNMCMWL